MSLVVLWASIVLVGIGILADDSVLREAVLLSAIAVAVLAFLSHQRARRFKEQAQTLERIDGWQVLEMEIRRARRHGRRLSLCRFEVDRAETAEIIEGMDAALRADDTAFVSGGTFYVILPEVDGHSALVPARRIMSELSMAGLEPNITIAAYPDDALTVRGLIDQLRSDSARRVSMTMAQDEKSGSVLSDEEV